MLKDQLVISCPMTGKPRAVQAADEAVEYGITREQQDAWAVRSHQRYLAARESGRLDDQIVAVEIPQRKGDPVSFSADESARSDTTVEKLAKLPTVYGSATVTAGNAPGLNTGATALLLMSVAEAQRRNVEPLATIHGWSMASGHPDRIASIPATAGRMALEKVGLGIDDMDVIEINEAFAAVPLVTTHILAGCDEQRAETIRERTNVNGGAIAIGHPTGATAARLVMTAMFELRRRRSESGDERAYHGLVTLCGGMGEGEALIVRVEG